MAVFDPFEQRMCVRVVYDGAAGAGKTTNVRQLGSLFAAQRKTAVYSPAELCGRTLYFDWMQVAAGAVCGFPLICQVVSVPGQAAFTARRRELLASADVVVFVCDSSERDLTTSLPDYLLDELAPPSGDAPPLVIQANKQDRPEAVDGKALLTAIKRTNVQVVEAIAAEGIGVVDTFVSAVRSAARAIQSRVEQQALRVPVGRIEDEHQLFARLAAVPIDRYGAANLVLEEASALFDAPPVFGDAVDAAVFEAPVESGTRETLRPRDATASDVAPLPTADVPTGHVWPAHTGRALLHTLSLADSVRLGPKGARLVSHDRVLTTSLASRFKDSDTARQALVRAARERTQLASLLVTDTVLVVQPAAAGGCWLWMIIPCTDAAGPWVLAEPRTRVEHLGTAIADAVAVTLRHGLSFEPSLERFGVQVDSIRYTGQIAATETPSSSALDLIFGVLADVATLPIDEELFIDAVTRSLFGRLRPEDLADLASDPRFTDASGVRDRLVRALQRQGVAA